MRDFFLKKLIKVSKSLILRKVVKMSTDQKFLKPRSLWQILIPYMDYWAVWAEIDHQRHRGSYEPHCGASLGSSGAIHPLPPAPSSKGRQATWGKVGDFCNYWRSIQVPMLRLHFSAHCLFRTDDLSQQWAFCLLTTILILNLSISFSILKYQSLEVKGLSGPWLIVGDLLDEIFRRSGRVW